jgi:agmatinase
MFPFPHDRSRSHHPADRPERHRSHHPDLTQLRGWRAMQAEADIPGSRWAEEKKWALRMGLTGSDSLTDKSIPTFARGELPHYAGINTFLKAPYAEDVTEVQHYDATVLACPFHDRRAASPVQGWRGLRD